MSLPLDQLPADLRGQVELLLSEKQRLEIEVRLLKEQLRLAYLAKYGRRSEKLSDQQLSLLDAEPSVTTQEVENEAEAAQAQEPTGQPASPARRACNQNHPGRVELPAHLERREVFIACPPEQTHCPECGSERPVIGYEVSEELDVEPAKYFVRVTKREKRGTPCHAEQGVHTAACPPKIISKSKLSNAMIVEIVLRKYDEHLPVYRQCAVLERDVGLSLSRQTLVEGIMAVGSLLEPVSRTMGRELIGGGYIQADETPMPCQSRRVRGRNHRAFLWEYSRPGGAVVFDFQMGRSRDGPRNFLKGFKGKLQCDGYAAYNDLGQGIVYVGCWAHARRPFYQAHKLDPEDPRPLEVLQQIKELYGLEEQARQQQLSVAQRLELRQCNSRPIVEGLKARVLEIRQEVLPRSQLGKACDYALGQWTRLEQFLKDGQLEADNNWCENAIRPLKLGARNWLHIGSELAGPKIAAIASVLETCRRLGINTRAYLNDVLPKLPEWPINRVAELVPSAWSSLRSTN